MKKIYYHHLEIAWVVIQNMRNWPDLNFYHGCSDNYRGNGRWSNRDFAACYALFNSDYNHFIVFSEESPHTRCSFKKNSWETLTPQEVVCPIISFLYNVFSKQDDSVEIFIPKLCGLSAGRNKLLLSPREMKSGTSWKKLPKFPLYSWAIREQAISRKFSILWETRMTFFNVSRTYVLKSPKLKSFIWIHHSRSPLPACRINLPWLQERIINRVHLLQKSLNLRTLHYFPLSRHENSLFSA